MSSQRWQRDGEEHAWRRPSRSGRFGEYRGRGDGDWGSSGQGRPSLSSSRSFWRPVNPRGEHQQKAVIQPDAAAVPHVQFPATTSTSPHPTLNSDEHKCNDQAPPKEFEVAPSTHGQLDLKQQQLQHQVPQHPLLQQQQQTRKDDDAVSSQSNSANPHILLSQAKPSEETRSPVQHQQAAAPSSIQMPMELPGSSVSQQLDAPSVQQNQLPQQEMLHQGKETEEMKPYSSRQMALPNSAPQSEPVGNYSPMTCAHGGYYGYRRQRVAPMPMLHKANTKYVVAKPEQLKRRQLNAILNKLTPQNFDKLLWKVREVNIDNAETLSWFVSQIFHRALMEPTFCQIYANLCFHLQCNLPDFSVDYETITFKRLLLNKSQEEFERGFKKEAEAGKSEEEAEIDQTKEKSMAARRRMLGNIRFIGELYKIRQLTERIMHECIKKLIGDLHSPDEGKIEALCKLMNTIGDMIDHPKSKEHMDAYFDMMQKLSTHQNLSWRVRFLLRDLIDLRENNWQQKCEIAHHDCHL